jgi:predicted transcriptional regulator
MSEKQLAIHHIRSLPPGVSLAQIAEEIAILDAIREGEKAADEGRVVSHEEVKRQVNQWLTSPPTPKPRPRSRC